MKCRPFFIRYAETWILGPCASISSGEFRIGLGLAFFEVGLCFIWERPYGYGCSGCGAIQAGTIDQLPPDWERRDKSDCSYQFFCPACKSLSASDLRTKNFFPKTKEDFWYCGALNKYQYKLHKAGKPWKTMEIELPCTTFLINPHSEGGGKLPEVGDIIPCIKKSNLVGYYLVTKKWRPFGSDDFLSWDDGYHVNLEFHHCKGEKKKDPSHETKQ